MMMSEPFPETMSESRPRLLFLCQTLPFPPDGGVQIRTYNVLRLLARDFDVTALCFYRAASQGHRAQVERSALALAFQRRKSSRSVR